MRRIESTLKKTNIRVEPEFEIVALLSDNQYIFNKVIAHGDYWLILSNNDNTQYAIVDFGLKRTYGIRPGYFHIENDKKYFIDLNHNIENLNDTYVLCADRDPIHENDENTMELSYYPDNHIAISHRDFKVLWGYEQEELYLTDDMWDRLYRLKENIEFIERNDIDVLEQEVNEYQELTSSN